MSDIKVTEEEINADGSVNFTIEGITNEEFNHILSKGLQVLIDEATADNKHGLVVTEFVDEVEDYLESVGANKKHTWEISDEEANQLFQVGALSILEEHIDREVADERDS